MSKVCVWGEFSSGTSEREIARIPAIVISRSCGVDWSASCVQQQCISTGKAKRGMVAEMLLLTDQKAFDLHPAPIQLFLFFFNSILKKILIKLLLLFFCCCWNFLSCDGFKHHHHYISDSLETTATIIINWLLLSKVTTLLPPVG